MSFSSRARTPTAKPAWPAWKAIGTGDFNGDGLSDILFQNADGQAAIWGMNGVNVIGGGTVGLDPGPGWKAIGSGNFTGVAGAGDFDILFQNAAGQVAIWEMNGADVIGGGSSASIPGRGGKPSGPVTSPAPAIPTSSFKMQRGKSRSGR